MSIVVENDPHLLADVYETIRTIARLEFEYGRTLSEEWIIETALSKAGEAPEKNVRAMLQRWEAEVRSVSKSS